MEALPTRSWQHVIEACFECAQTFTARADACLAEPTVTDLVRCVRLNLDCADVCETTGKILSRLTKTEPSTARDPRDLCRGVPTL